MSHHQGRRGREPSAEAFAWDVFLLAGDAESSAKVPPDQAFGSQDGLWFDREGRLWTQTDGTQPTVHGAEQNNQMLAADTGYRGAISVDSLSARWNARSPASQPPRTAARCS